MTTTISHPKLCVLVQYPYLVRITHEEVTAVADSSKRGLRGRKDSYYESTTAVRFPALFRCVTPLMRLKRAKNWQ